MAIKKSEWKVAIGRRIPLDIKDSLEIPLNPSLKNVEILKLNPAAPGRE